MILKNFGVLLLITLVYATEEYCNYDDRIEWFSGSLRFEDLPDPIDVISFVSEDQYNNYYDFWLDCKQNISFPKIVYNEAGCTVPINTLTEPQPVYLLNGKLIVPTGSSGTFTFNTGEEIELHCSGSNNVLSHPSIILSLSQALLECDQENSFIGSGWLEETTNFGDVKCNTHTPILEEKIGTCVGGRGITISIGVSASDDRHHTILSCFNEVTAEVMYVEYTQESENKFVQTNVARPSFMQGPWFPGLSVNTLYTQASQKNAIASVVGEELAENYVNATNFLARGHLAAKTDYILSTSQRATFTFINTVPQWQPFNAGNWATLERTLKNRINEADYKTTIYTGSWDILKLKDDQGIPREIYLSPQNRKLPVPLIMYKVVHDKISGRGTAFVSLNNPHLTLQEAKDLMFCPDVCINNDDFNWLSWRPDDIYYGFSFCCDVNDFRRTVNVLPPFIVTGLLY